ncbi:hypothetical protein [Aeoliella sp.]|uniref:hypothetical protein n=1 Tax=Aeoliella sp. TaxID=2795800 RepID=UPI003CCBB5F0
MNRLILLIFAAGCVVQSTVTAQELFRDEMTSGAGWGVNASSGDSAATFGYNYSADDIPEAPNSQGGDTATTGVKLEANITAGALDVFTLYPIGESFSGSYQLRFDAWMNYDANERINGGSAGTTEFLGGGIGYDNVAADIGIGAQILATNDGGSGSDWRAFGDGSFLDPSEMIAGSRNGFDSHYSDFLPGVAPPAGQAQAAFPAGTAGSPGFQWITFEVNTAHGRSAVFIEKPGGDRLHITTINAYGARPYTSDGNIGVVYADFFSSVTSRPDLTFGIVDNVVVNQIPEPGTAMSLTIVSCLALAWRHRRSRAAK